MTDPSQVVRSRPSRTTVAGLVIAAAIVLMLLVAPEVLLIGFAGVLLAVFLDGGSGVLSRWTGLPQLVALPLFMVLIVAGFVSVGWRPCENSVSTDM